MSNKFEWDTDEITYTPPPDDGGGDDVQTELDRVTKILEEADASDLVGDEASLDTLYVGRKVLNNREIYNWAKANGIPDLVDAAELHVTLAYSRTPVDWMEMGAAWEEKLELPAGGPRRVEVFGQDAIVLAFASSQLSWRHEEFKREGASWDFPEYRPHITVGRGALPEDIMPYTGRILLGPEIFEEVKEDEPLPTEHRLPDYP